MPWWRTRYYRRYRNRPRRLWRRRFRGPFQRRLWRRKRYWVRKRKLKTIKLKQWQPHFIRNLKVKGYYPLFMGTSERTANNNTLYLESTAPHYVPSGGLFSICNFSLEMLYKDHLTLKNWWTTGNDNMPLIRYLGCTITLYRSTNCDYMFYYNNAWPMKASMLTYQSCNPAIMRLNKHTVYMPCKQHNRNKKPYKKLRIRPPPQMNNQWYFQKDIAELPLLQTMSTACSFDRMYMNSNSISTTIGFTSLDTQGFKNHNFTRFPSTGYVPKEGELLFGTTNGHDIQKLKITDLIYLGNTDDLEIGTVIGSIPTTSDGTQTKIEKQIIACKDNKKYWGNPFKSSRFYFDERIITTNKNWNQIISQYKNGEQLGAGWTEKTTKTIECRYNPFYDKGIHNEIYLLKIDALTHTQSWDPPQEPQIIAKDLPLWALTFGYIDYQKRAAIYNNIDTTTVFVIHSPYITPKDFPYYVPLDQDFLYGRSPYRPENNITPSDQQNWHPKTAFQLQSINTIASCSPGTIKLPKQTSTESHIKYRFNFKVGGNPPPMSNVTDPDNQPKYPTANNLIQTTSLQNPKLPFQYILWNFDERRGTLTKKAAKRITQYQEPENSVLPITETSSLSRLYKEETDSSQTTTSEEEETPIETRLLRERRKQKLLRKRINLLLNRLTNID
nr:MAG: ORF1 [TTV-like mini virus]